MIETVLHIYNVEKLILQFLAHDRFHLFSCSI